MCVDQLPRGGELTCRTSWQSAVANHLFKTAGSANNIRRSIRVQRNVPEMSGSSNMALEQTAISEYRATNPRAEQTSKLSELFLSAGQNLNLRKRLVAHKKENEHH